MRCSPRSDADWRKIINIAQLIYQETKDLPETDAMEVLDFVEFLKTKRQRKSQPAENQQEKPDMSEFDQFGSVYDSHFNRDACYDRYGLR